MLDIGSSELLLIVIVAVVVIGPKDLPRVLYKLGQLMGKGRAMTRHFRAGIDEMVRQAELEELEKKWAADNARIMAQTQDATTDTGEAEAAQSALPEPDAPDSYPVGYDVGPEHGPEHPPLTPPVPPVAAPVAPAQEKPKGGPAA